jgi:hypothetical protein
VLNSVTVEQRGNFPKISKPSLLVSRAVEELFGCLTCPQIVADPCSVGDRLILWACPCVPAFLLTESHANSQHRQVERKRHGCVACLVTTNPTWRFLVQPYLSRVSQSSMQPSSRASSSRSTLGVTPNPRHVLPCIRMPGLGPGAVLADPLIWGMALSSKPAVERSDPGGKVWDRPPGSVHQGATGGRSQGPLWAPEPRSFRDRPGLSVGSWR